MDKIKNKINKMEKYKLKATRTETGIDYERTPVNLEDARGKAIMQKLENLAQEELKKGTREVTWQVTFS